MPAQMQEQVERAPVGVVQVFQDERERLIDRQLAQEVGNSLQQPVTIALRVGRAVRLDTQADLRSSGTRRATSVALHPPTAAIAPASDEVVGTQRLDEGEVGRDVLVATTGKDTTARSVT
jgi:hypothetical protein